MVDLGEIERSLNWMINFSFFTAIFIAGIAFLNFLWRIYADNREPKN